MSTTLSIFALGGLYEIGKNMYIIEHNDVIIVIDCGNKFPDESLLGIDLIIPDITYLLENKQRVKALIVTHGHEDHIGGIPFFLDKINVPVYATRFTMGLIELKLKEHKLLSEAQLHEIHSNSTISFSDMTIEFFKVNHSIPDCLGIVFRTPAGTIVHTGDFKFDWTSAADEHSDIHKMAAIGNEGVLLLLSESTNAERHGLTPSEENVGIHMLEAFIKARRKVIISTFASNINRIQQIVDAAIKTNRKLALLGRSMVNVVNVAIERGYLQVPEDMLIDQEMIHQLKPEQVAILCTGSQGEALAALSRLSNGSFRGVEILRDDTVILAAGPIPGNEKSVSKIIDNLFEIGANVIYGSSGMHVSGHGYEEDLKLMLTLMKPKYFIPIHGEYRMLHKHRLLAEKVGVAEGNTFIINNGDVVDITDQEARQTRKIHAGNTYIDGIGFDDVADIVLRDRKQLSEDGIVTVVLTISKMEQKLVNAPDIISRGFIHGDDSEKILKDMNKLILKTTHDILRTGKYNQWNAMKQNIRKTLGQHIFSTMKKKPMILPIIIEI